MRALLFHSILAIVLTFILECRSYTDPLTGHFKDAWADLQKDIKSAKKFLDTSLCTRRASLFTELRSISTPGIEHYLATLLVELGLCELQKKDYKSARQKFQSAASELGTMSQEGLNKIGFGHVEMLEKASSFLEKGSPVGAALQFRRVIATLERNVVSMKKHLFANVPVEQRKQVEQQINEEAEKSFANFILTIRRFLQEIDNNLVRGFSHAEAKRGRILKREGPYILGIPPQPWAPKNSVYLASQLDIIQKDLFSMLASSINLDALSLKTALMLKGGYEGSGCKKNLSALCNLLNSTRIKINDATTFTASSKKQSVWLVKMTKKDDKVTVASLETCSNNMGILLVYPLKNSSDSVSNLQLVINEAQLDNFDEAVAVDLCSNSILKLEPTSATEKGAPEWVLLMEMWHPMVALFERSSYTRKTSLPHSLTIVNTINKNKKFFENAVEMFLNADPTKSRYFKEMQKLQKPKTTETAQKQFKKAEPQVARKKEPTPEVLSSVKQQDKQPQKIDSNKKDEAIDPNSELGKAIAKLEEISALRRLEVQSGNLEESAKLLTKKNKLERKVQDLMRKQARKKSRKDEL